MQEFLTNDLLPQVLSAIGVALTGILVVVIKSVGSATVEFIQKKKEAVEQQLNLDKHTELLEMGRMVWNIVEEKFRITENIEEFVGSKANEFDKLLLEKLPFLDEKQVAEIRQAIAGEVNKGKDVLFKNAFKEEVKLITEENAKLIEENNNLKSQVNTNVVQQVQ